MAAVLVLRGGAPVHAVAARTPLAGAVTYGGVGYRLRGVNVTDQIPQPGGSAVLASGTFEIVTLGLDSTDRRLHVVSSDLLALDAQGTYYGVSSPDVLGLNDRRWGALTPTTTVPAQGGLTVKAVFDIPPAVARRPVSLRIGQFDYVDQAPAQTLDLPPCCGAGSRLATPARAIDGPLVPSPLLG